MSRRRVEKLESAMYTTKDIDQHIGLLSKQVEKSLRDPETRQLAVKIVSGSFDYQRDPRTGREVAVVRAWGKSFIAPPGETCPPRSDECEVEACWDFVCLNVRYVYDITDVDTFATAKATLDAGGGDCDDGCILFASLLKALGFTVAARVIATKDNPSEWIHVYSMCGIPKDNPQKFVPLDWTVSGKYPGWEFGGIAATRDYIL